MGKEDQDAWPQQQNLKRRKIRTMHIAQALSYLQLLHVLAVVAGSTTHALYKLLVCLQVAADLERMQIAPHDASVAVIERTLEYCLHPILYHSPEQDDAHFVSN